MIFDLLQFLGTETTSINCDAVHFIAEVLMEVFYTI
jgi:hypothetical protein